MRGAHGRAGVTVLRQVAAAAAILMVAGASAVAQDEVFRDDFADPEATGWVLEETETGVWTAPDDGGLLGSGSAFAVNEARVWAAAQIEVEIADLSGTLNLNTRMSPADRTFVSLVTGNGLGVEVRQGYPGSRIGERSVIDVDFPIVVVIEDRDDVVAVSVDGVGVVEAVRREPGGEGSFAFETVGDSRALIASLAIRLLEIEQPPGDGRPEIPDVVGMLLDDAIERLGSVEQLDVGWTPSTPPAEDELVIVHEQLDDPDEWFVELALGTFVPDLAGMSAQDAADEAARHGLAVSLDGDVDAGSVVGQDPEPGEWIAFGESVEATLEAEGGFPRWVIGIGGIVVVVGGLAVRAKVKETRRQREREERRPAVVSTRLVLSLPRVEVDAPEGDLAGTSTRVGGPESEEGAT